MYTFLYIFTYSHFSTLRGIIFQRHIMKFRKIPSFLISFVTLCSILGVSAMVIAYGRGYRLDFTKNTVNPTGLISATSDPIGAQVYVDGKLKTATNNSFNVKPNWYTVTISKEGYISWQKRIRVQGEVVSRADAFLFPTNPSLSPLTMLGIKNPTLSPDGNRIAYIIPPDHLNGNDSKKAGLWVYELVEGPLGRNRDPIQLGINDTIFKLTDAALLWSPDSTSIMTQNGMTTRLYQIGKTDTFKDITSTAGVLITEWNKERDIKEIQKLESFKQPIIDMATTSAHILAISPDETKILYEATASATIPQIIEPSLIGTNSTEENRTIQPGNIYVYDSKEDRNYFLLAKTELPPAKVTPAVGTRTKTTPTPDQQNNRTANIHWFPTSKHLLLTLKDKIDIMEYDRTNWVTVYSGPFQDSFVAPWSNGSRIILLTNLNPTTSTLPNLYTVNLR